MSGKYKMTILYLLFEFRTLRFNELQREIGTIPFKTLSATLKELESNSLVERTDFSQVPPRVEYSLTPKAYSLIPVLDTMCIWGEDNFVSEFPDDFISCSRREKE